MLKRAFQALTGAEPGEQLPTLLSFLALLFLLLSYYLVKPLRDSLFLSYFVSRDMAWFSLPIIVLSLASAKFFNHWVGRVPRYRLMSITFAIMMACKLLFVLLLPIAGRWGTVVFFLWASIYFTLVLSILWGVVNTIFSSGQAERCFGFVALGGTTGNIVGAQLSSWLAVSAFKDWALAFSVVAMGVALGLILLAVRSSHPESSEAAEKEHGAAATHVSRGWQDIQALFGNRYVRGIAMMVFALALISQAFQFQAYSQLDRNLAHQVYTQEFGWFDAQGASFEKVFGFKRLDQAPQAEALKQLAQTAGLPAAGQAKLSDSYGRYQAELKSRTSKAFADVYKFQGLLGVFLLMVVARLLFRNVGLRWVVLILPLFYILASLSVMFPLDVLVVQLLMMLAGSLNYSLNNATKELLYTPTSEAVRFQFKPLIEGPVMRLGDLTAAILQIAVSSTVVLWLALNDMAGGNVLLVLGLVFVLLWMLAIFHTGRRYDRAQQADAPLQELDLAEDAHA
ncbi:MAG: hypothetical protein ACAI44_00750 [Candidatus Sericytochromatia bacterium]